jgi:gamma-glutamyltranspeptidase / glutathione hydrolase
MNRTHTFLVAVALAWLATAPVFAGPTETIGVPAKALPEQAKGKPPSFAGQAFRQGVVSVANPHGAEAGAQVLEAGGNAVDAAVAIAYALNVVEPQSAGVGGGGFMMIHIARTGETVMIDTRERAPAGATRDMFVGVSSASQQGRAVGVPGMVKGTALAVQRYGRLPLANSVEPAIRLASEGFAATPRYVSASCSNRATAYPETAAYFCPGGISRVAVGEIVTNPPLAETFRAIAQGGPDAFYSGDIAKGIVEGQKRFLGTTDRGGSMTLDDLVNYQVSVRAPYEGTYRGYIIRSVPSPSSGGLTLLMMLKMIERFPIGDAAQGFGFGATRTLNVMAEALRIGFADRGVWMGDADFSYVPARGLLHPTYLAMRSAAINPDARMTPNPIALDPRPYDVAGLKARTRLAVAEPAEVLENGTTHFSVTDEWGNMVSYTNTIESSHGIGVFAGYYQPDGTFRNFGFLLNNELTDFNTTPTTHPYPSVLGAIEPGTNDVAPNKRPRSSMTPTLVFSPDGKPIAALGSPGGTTIIPAVFNVLLNLVDHKMSIQDAINAPRISVTAAGGAISAEPGFPAATITELRALGHTVNVAGELNIGSVQVVVTDEQTGKQYGGADPRREGTVIGLPR